ncbi:hypothetical protein ACFLWA_10755 [Chloroflexota bacterium]
MRRTEDIQGLSGCRGLWGQAKLGLRRLLQWTGRPWVRRVVTVFLTLFAVAGIAVMLYANWDSLRAMEFQIRPVPLLLSFLAYTLALAFVVLAWIQMMTALGSTAKWREHLRVYCVANLARRVPGILWHVVGRVALYDHDRSSIGVISLASGLELALMAVSGLMIGVLAWPGMALDLIQPVWIAGVIILGLAVVHPRVLGVPLRWARAQGQHGSEMELNYGQVLGWLLLYGGSWIAGGTVLFALIDTLYPLPLNQLPLTVGAWCLSGMVSVIAAFLPVGFGLRELALGLLLASYLPSGLAIVVALLARLLLIGFELVWALLALLIGRESREVVRK